jgi:hypothetical protein
VLFQIDCGSESVVRKSLAKKLSTDYELFVMTEHIL